MKSFKRHSLFTLPVMSLLALAPSMLMAQSSEPERMPAVQEVIKVRSAEISNEEPVDEEILVTEEKTDNKEEPVQAEAEAEPEPEPEAEADEKKEVIAVKEEPTKKEVCEEKTHVLPDQFNQLMMNQNMIMMAMMNLTQSMMQFMQQQQQNAYLPYMQNASVPYHHSYPYSAQTPNGNWVYLPSGFQAANQVPFQQPLPSAGGIYPEQLGPNAPAELHHQMARPQMQGMALDGPFAPTFPNSSMIPGVFGANAFGYNFGL
jgi:hypothetical protein